MHNPGREKIDPFILAAMVLFAALAVAVGVALPNAMPMAIMILAVSAVLFYWALRWDVTLWAWLWVLSYLHL